MHPAKTAIMHQVALFVEIKIYRLKNSYAVQLIKVRLARVSRVRGVPLFPAIPCWGEEGGICDFLSSSIEPEDKPQGIRKR